MTTPVLSRTRATPPTTSSWPPSRGPTGRWALRSPKGALPRPLAAAPHRIQAHPPRVHGGLCRRTRRRPRLPRPLPQ
eukprot:2589028-Lingulodinium_polyedra.AAC.1